MACGPVMESDMETREQMEARHEAERAALEAMGPYSALCGLIRFHETGGHEGDGSDAALVRAKAELAAAPLMPVQAMGEDEIEALAHDLAGHGDWTDTLDLARLAIRATLARLTALLDGTDANPRRSGDDT